MNKFPITIDRYNNEVKTVEEFDLIEEYESYFEHVVILSPNELEYLYPDRPSKRLNGMRWFVLRTPHGLCF